MITQKRIEEIKECFDLIDKLQMVNVPAEDLARLKELDKEFTPVNIKRELLSAVESLREENEKLKESLDKFFIWGSDSCRNNDKDCQGSTILFARSGLCLECEQLKANQKGE